MRNPIAIVLIALLAVALYFVIAPMFGDEPPPITSSVNDSDEGAVDAITSELDATKVAPAGFSGDDNKRSEITTEAEALDPSIIAALAGFRGRVIDHNKQPVAGTLLTLLRFAPDVVMNPGKSIFVDEETSQPDIDAGEARTDEDGYFELTGVWPRAFYLLRAGQDQGAPTLRVIQRIPGPGEIVDIGDIVLLECGTLVGTVVDPDGEPVADALVRAVDLPGAVLSMVPLQRIDPKGGLIVTEGDTQLVLQFPSWVERRFDELPIAKTRTGTDGTFKLEGVPAGGNLVAVTHPLWLSVVKPRVVVKAGREKNLKRLRMGEGETVMGKVLDMEDNPIADAQIVVASATPVGKVHFASYAKPSAADGSFSFPGVPAKDVVVAARRSKGDPWVILDAQPASLDVTVHLPSEHAIHITLVSEMGKEITKPRFQLTEGKRSRGAVEMAMWGATRPINIKDRLSRTEDGVYVIKGIPEGDYVLLADAPGHAARATDINLFAKAEISIELKKAITFDVSVVDARGKPVRGATIYVQAGGKRPRLPDFPLNTGRTDKDGVVHVSQVNASEIKLTAQHPAYGTSHGDAKFPLSAPLVLVLQDPGTIRGELTEAGSAPTPGKWSITISRQWSGSGDRGAMPDLPRIVTPNLEGQFEATGLKPGKYRVSVFTTLEMIKSPGKVMDIAETMFMSTGMPDRSVEVLSGQTVNVRLDALEKDAIEGPSAMVTGTVTVNGRLAKGMTVTGNCKGHRTRVSVDAQGNFDLGQMPIGNVSIRVNDRSGGLFSGSNDNLYSSSHKIEEGADLDVTIEISTSSASGTVSDISGTQVAGVRVSLQGQTRNPEGKLEGNIWRSEVTDQNGQFTFENLPIGRFAFTANHDSTRGNTQAIDVDAGSPSSGIQIQLHTTYKLKGSVDTSALGEDKPKNIWLYAEPVGKENPTNNSWANITGDGSFTMNNLDPGTYKISVSSNSSRQGFSIVCDNRFTISSGNIEGYVVRLHFQATK